jgi:hypothetical protein
VAIHTDMGLYAGLGLIAGPILFAHGFRDFRLRRLMQNTPTSRIRSMPMGLVEVSGLVEPRSAVIAPFSGRDCVFWELDIATRTRRSGWTVVHRNASGHPFFLRDDTGVALVYPKDATTRLRPGMQEECPGIQLPDCYARYMADQHLAFRALWRAGVMRFRERVIEAGQPVYVLGTATPRPHSIAISDDEVLSATGTEDLRAKPLRVRDQETAAVIRRGEHQKTFVLSEESERELTLTLGVRSLAELFGGPLITLAGLGYWLMSLSARGGR